MDSMHNVELMKVHMALYASVPSPDMQLCVPVDVIRLEDIVTILENACMSLS